MNRYYKYNYLATNFLLSKNSVYTNDLKSIPTIKNIKLEAGHFRFTTLVTEHGLILVSLATQLPYLTVFKHGKRLRHTATMSVNIAKHIQWKIMDKFMNIVWPLMENFPYLPPLQIKYDQTEYRWRLQSYFNSPEISSFITDRLLKKDKFLPLFLVVRLNTFNRQDWNETYLRILRLPIKI